MQYVRNLSDSVSTAWNSINPATLSGAIDVIVVEHEDGSLSCSPFHVRFGKFSLLRPSEKKVEFRVNGVKQSYSMKLGEGGEAFFVFETTDNIPQSMQTSPLVSPANSPPLDADADAPSLQEPEPLELDPALERPRPQAPPALPKHQDYGGMLTPASTSPTSSHARLASGDWSTSLPRSISDNSRRNSARLHERPEALEATADASTTISERSNSPPLLGPKEALERAVELARGLSAAGIPTRLTERGDLMLDMSGFKGSEEDMLRAEILARKILSEKLEGHYDIGALFGFDGDGNLWIYSSEEAKTAAMDKTLESSLAAHRNVAASDAVSDPGYQSDGSDAIDSHLTSHRRTGSDAGPEGIRTPPRTPTDMHHAGDPNRNYAKTLRLTSEQLRDLDLRPGENSMSFTVNRATCSSNMYLWKHETPVVISDIDGTITKSDALGHVLNMIGRDWTHTGIAKLYSDIEANGYNIMYLTSRSVGQADTTRAYLRSITQEGCRMPHGPTILSPDRTMAALRREIYLRKPEVFKMATLRDIRNLYDRDRSPFYAGFGNRLTDQISYRTVDVPRNRIFTINSNSEVSLDLLSLNKLKMSYVNINEVVDHYFPPVSTLVKGGGEEYTDFKYWRDDPLELADFSASDSEEHDYTADQDSRYAEDEDEDEDAGDGLADSWISRGSMNEYTDGELTSSSMRESIEYFYGRRSGEYEELEEVEEEEEEEDGNDEEDKDLETRLIESRTEPKLTPPALPTALPESQVVMEDANAEVITGIRDISLGVRSVN